MAQKKSKPSDPFSPFAYVKSVTNGKINIIAESENPDLAERAYNPYIINKALALYRDVIFYANEMNMRHNLDKKLQYDYYLNTIRKAARYEKWIKVESSDDLEAVKLFFGMSNEKAKQALTVLTADQLKTIKIRLEEGRK